jgi:hypothetical protein
MPGSSVKRWASPSRGGRERLGSLWLHLDGGTELIIDPEETAGWIPRYEEKGERMKG